MTSNKVPTNEQIIREAQRRWEVAPNEQKWRLEHYVIEVVREGWTPPEPVDPDVLAFREWFAGHEKNDGKNVLAGKWDGSIFAIAYLAGARMAAERERERAGLLVRYIEDLGYAEHRAALLAEYRGEA